VDEALALRNTMLADAMKQGNDILDEDEKMRFGVETAGLAQGVEDAATQNASLETALAIWKNGKASSSRKGELIEALEKAGRVTEAFALRMDGMVEDLKKTRRKDAEAAPGASFARSLLQLYTRQERFADALVLLGEMPWWGRMRDVLELKDNSCRSPSRDGISAAVARVLIETGRADEASQYLAAIMRDDHSMDWAYELLLHLAGDDLSGFIARMDELYARDAFEERPLIWKAEALRRMKKLDEAEEVVRFALKVDPTDGEQPAGDRVRAYAVLADILDEKGKPADAQFFKDVVKSVRLAEEGDKFNRFDLLKRSMARYSEAETLFADAYCVQWRLAERMRAMGKTEEARKHYEIAFERMPEQFGQVASLCFGCQGIFESEESVSAAEDVLTRLVATPPVRPAAYYLMGQLREEQGRNDEAADCYAKALETDPHYLDVLKRFYSLREKVKRDDAVWSGVQSTLIRLDPLGRNFDVSRDEIWDWAVFWEARNAASKKLPAKPDAVFPLTANIARLDAKKAEDAAPKPAPRAVINNPAAGMLLSTTFASILEKLDAQFAKGADAGEGVEDDDDDEDEIFSIDGF
jgi:tetratricopeptide (TPR) repeat protein